MILNTPLNEKRPVHADDILYGYDTEKTNTPTTVPNKTNTEPVEYDSTAFRDTTEGDKLWGDYINAANAYNQGSVFNYVNQTNLDSIMKQILAGKDFKYDFNEDAMYQQYKDTYAKQAKLASQDVMGQAAAMTGGYGNSYAASVGNQAYQQELGKINDVIPELYQLALDRHNMEQNQLMQKYSAYADDYNRRYTKHLNDLSALGDARDEALRQYNVASGEYYDKQYNDNANAWNQAEFDREQIWRDEDMALDLLYGANNKSDGGDFSKAIFSRTDLDGNNVFYIDGKEQTFAPGVNPYTGTKNKDVANGTFSNGYQPNNINGEKLTKTGITDVVNGVTQNVWKTPDGTKWIWDGTQNKYLRYEEE